MNNGGIVINGETLKKLDEKNLLRFLFVHHGIEPKAPR
jgi:hypothetical protein